MNFAGDIASSQFENMFMTVLGFRMYSVLGPNVISQTSMTDEEFQSHKESLMAEKQGMPSSLFEESERYWEQIWKRRYVPRN